MYLNDEEKKILNLLGWDGESPVTAQIVLALQDTAEYSDDPAAREAAGEILLKLG